MRQDVIEFNTHGFTYFVSLGHSHYARTPTAGSKKLRKNGLPDITGYMP